MTISTLAQLNQTIQNLSQLQTKGSQLEQQISSGLTSQTYAGIATQAEQLVDLTATQSQQQSYINTINTVDTRLQTMSLATSTMATIIQQFADSFSGDAYDTTGSTVQAQAQSLLAQFGDYLNTQDGEGYVFSGSETTSPPFNASGLPDPGDLVTNVAGAPPDGYYQGNDAVNEAQVGPDQTLQYGITGDNPAFEEAIRALNFIANSGSFSSTNPTDEANVAAAQQLLSQAGTALQQLTAQIGMQQSDLNTELSTHQQTLSLTQGSIGDIENVNSAQAITQLDTLQTQLEASYQTVNIMQSLSLANYLK